MSQLAAAISAVQAEVDALCARPTGLGFDAEAALAVVPELAAAQAQVAAATLAAVGAVDVAEAFTLTGARSTGDWLTRALVLDPAPARQMARFAAELRLLPSTRAALAKGAIDPARAQRITVATAKARRHVGPDQRNTAEARRDGISVEQLAAGEAFLADRATYRPAEHPTSVVLDPVTGEQVPVVDEEVVDPETGEIRLTTRAPGEERAALSPHPLTRLAQSWLEAVLPAETQEQAQRQAKARQLFLSQTLNGMWDVKGLLTPEAGVALAAALEAGMLAPEAETPMDAPTRRHDALCLLAEHFLATALQGEGTLRGQRPQVLLTLDVRDLLVDTRTQDGEHALSRWVPACTCQLPPSLGGAAAWSGGRPEPCSCAEPRDPTTDPDLLDHVLRRARPTLRAPGGQASPISPEAARRFALNADVRRVLLDGHVPLDLGRTRRLASRDQRIALHLRDGYRCRFGPCQAPATWLVAHHQLYWSHDGPTDLSNLVSLCDHHHARVHQQRWVISGDPDELLTFTSSCGRFTVSSTPRGPTAP